MQVEAIYDQGRLEFARPLKLKHQRIRLIVDIADDEIVDPSNPYELEPEILAAAAQMRSRLDAIRLAPLRPDAELPELTPKQLERIEAFALREDR